MKLLASLKGPFIDFFIFLKLSWKLSHIFQTIMIFIGLRKFLSYFIPKVVLVAVTGWLGIGDGGYFQIY